MRIEVNFAYEHEETIWSVVLEDGEQRFELICHSEEAALALRASLIRAIETHTIEEIEE